MTYNYQDLSGEKPERKYDIQIHTLRVLRTNSDGNRRANTLKTKTVQVAQTNLINIYPNPAMNTIRIAYQFAVDNSIGVLNITDLAGKPVKSFKITDNKGIVSEDISDLAPGLYLCTMLINNVTFQRSKLSVIK